MNATTTRQIACGNTKAHGRSLGVQHHHSSVAQVRECFATEGGIWSIEDAEHAESQEWTYDPDAAHERHLENAGWAEARAQEDHEAAMGVVSFEDAMAAAQRQADGSVVFPDEDGMPPLVIGPGAEQPTLDVKVKPDFVGLPDGTYTVEMAQGHRTYQVKTQKPDAKFAPGQRIVSVLSGSDNETDYVGLGFVSTDHRGVHRLRAWKKYHASGRETQEGVLMLLENPRAALVAGKCARCRRTLTTPESLARGLGEECAGKMGV